MGKAFKKIDKVLLVVTIIFCLFGLLMIFSASSVSTVLRYRVPEYYFFTRQVIFIIAGCIAGFILVKVPVEWYRILIVPYLLLIIVLLFGLYIYGSVKGNAQSWYDLGMFSIQPTEFAKTAIIVFYAFFYEGLERNKIKGLFWYFIPLIISFAIAYVVYKQPDMGSALIILAMSFLIFINVPYIKKNFLDVVRVFSILVFIGSIGLLVLTLSGKSLLTKGQMDRFNFANPCDRYTEKTGYQVCNGLIAMSSGGLTGVGLNNSTQKRLYLPESHTDFIFPIIVEELGLVAGVLVILMYLVLLFRIRNIAKRGENIHCGLIGYGAYWYISLHVVINILGVLALIPLTGVPLPFLSYGGSFTMNLIAILFLVQRCCVESKTLKLRREIKEL